LVGFGVWKLLFVEFFDEGHRITFHAKYHQTNLLRQNLADDKRQVDAVRPQTRIFQVIIAIIVVTYMRMVVIV